MAIDRTDFNVPASILRTGDLDIRTTLRLLEQIATELNGRWVVNVAQLDITVEDPPTQANVQAIGNKVNEIIVALINARIMDPESS